MSLLLSCTGCRQILSEQFPFDVVTIAAVIYYSLPNVRVTFIYSDNPNYLGGLWIMM